MTLGIVATLKVKPPLEGRLSLGLVLAEGGWGAVVPTRPRLLERVGLSGGNGRGSAGREAAHLPVTNVC